LLVLWATQFSVFVWLLVLFLLASPGASTSALVGSKAIAAWFPHSQQGGAMLLMAVEHAPRGAGKPRGRSKKWLARS
ncbi:MAG TPA: hypothetical protein VGP38_02190, partial [Rubrobacter sp.]|nr:hypothetical protein [Rubrobacter sp.]